MKGEKFLEVYGSHDDPITEIKLNKSYAIQAPTAHPIYENFRVKVGSIKSTTFYKRLKMTCEFVASVQNVFEKRTSFD